MRAPPPPGALHGALRRSYLAQLRDAGEVKPNPLDISINYLFIIY